MFFSQSKCADFLRKKHRRSQTCADSGTTFAQRSWSSDVVDGPSAPSQDHCEYRCELSADWTLGLDVGGRCDSEGASRSHSVKFR